MSFAKNQYYKLEAIGTEAVSYAETLLKQYPLTKMFLGILGQSLMDQIQFGLFEPGSEIIRQGATGKDLFLICNHNTDVVVNTKRIMQLQAPVMVGDKGIIDKDSVRNATILISAGFDSLVVKIPLELFIRSFKTQNIKDSEFTQEKKIYFHLFLEVQERLFKYARIQKNLWEEINTSLHSLNTQLITGALHKEEDKNWGVAGWQVIQNFLKSAFGVSWPETVDKNIANLSGILQKILDRKLPPEKFKGTEQQYAFKRQMVWKAWLNSLSELLVKELPHDKLPISIGEVELFNPHIYQMRVSHLLRSIERKFMLKKVKPKGERINPELLKAAHFFGMKAKQHEFDLDRYTRAVNSQFVFKNPNRVMAQLTQQIAQLTATCENEFNDSVSKMQHFLEKIRNLTPSESEKQEATRIDERAVLSYVAAINQGFSAYNRRATGRPQPYVGEVRFNEMGSPNITQLIKSCGSEQVRNKVVEANAMLVDMLELADDNLGPAELVSLLHFCEAYPGDMISPLQLASHYWVAISPGIGIEKLGVPFSTLRPGTLIGGSSWDLQADDEIDSENAWNLSVPEKRSEEEQTFLVCAVPNARLPWVINSLPSEEEFNRNHLPALQWLIARHISHLSVIEQLRDFLFDRYARITEVVITEKKVRQFEHNKSIVSEEDFQKIQQLVLETLGMKLGQNPRASSELLSRQIYKWLIEQSKRDFPNLTTEEQGNKAYTLWRFIQSQIVKEVFLKGTGEEVKLKTPTSVFELIGLEIEKSLRKASVEKSGEGLAMVSTPPEIDLTKLFQKGNLMPDRKLDLALGILQTLEKHVVMLTDEASDYQQRLKEVRSVKTEFDVQEMKEQFISESIEKLRKILYDKLGSGSEAP